MPNRASRTGAVTANMRRRDSHHAGAATTHTYGLLLRYIHLHVLILVGCAAVSRGAPSVALCTRARGASRLAVTLLRFDVDLALRQIGEQPVRLLFLSERLLEQLRLTVFAHLPRPRPHRAITSHLVVLYV